MTPSELRLRARALRMKELRHTVDGDIEGMHSEGDAILCEIMLYLVEFDSKETQEIVQGLIDDWTEMPKWYA